MNTEDFNKEEEASVVLTEGLKSGFKRAAKWGNFMAIVGFVGSGAVFLTAFYVKRIFNSLSSGFVPGGMNIGGSALVTFYLIIAVMYLVPSYYLYKFSSKVREALRAKKPEEIENGVYYLGRLFRFMGIFTLISLIFTVLFVVFVILGQMMGSAL